MMCAYMFARDVCTLHVHVFFLTIYDLRIRHNRNDRNPASNNPAACRCIRGRINVIGTDTSIVQNLRIPILKGYISAIERNARFS